MLQFVSRLVLETSAFALPCPCDPPCLCNASGALTCLPGKLCGDLPDQLWQAPTRGARENSGWGWAVATSLLCVHTTSRHR